MSFLGVENDEAISELKKNRLLHSARNDSTFFFKTSDLNSLTKEIILLIRYYFMVQSIDSVPDCDDFAAWRNPDQAAVSRETFPAAVY
jgi:hypothetical protein